MNIIEILFVGIGLAMDAFAVSICKGLSIKKLNCKKMIVIALYFGLFQAIMPLIGYILGSTFEDFIIKIDHWIAFILLLIIGISMIKDAFSKKVEKHNDLIDIKTMLILALATSIDALVVGMTFAFLKTNIVLAILIIGSVTFILSLIGVKIGNKVGLKYEKKSQIVGGVILIFIGSKILLEHLNLLK